MHVNYACFLPLVMSVIMGKRPRFRTRTARQIQNWKNYKFTHCLGKAYKKTTIGDDQLWQQTRMSVSFRNC